ncbi:MAG TPA: D-alanine--D-alanine ligase family protein [Trueperaceae bacterium]
MTRPRVLLLCGGQSEEHEVSLSSACSVMAAAGDRFDITSMVIDRAGRLLSPEASLQTLGNPAAPTSGETRQVQHLPRERFDVVFPLLHGPLGEDGSVQGLLKLMGLPFVGSDVLGSAVGMDKLIMKAVFADRGLPQGLYRAVKRRDWHQRPEGVLDTLEAALPYPLFVKPANMGSSVGIGKARNRDELQAALTEAARHDRRIIVEAAISGVRELEVGILGNDDPQVSPVGEIRYASDFYDYRSKYEDGQAELNIPARIPSGIAERCRELALAAFEAIDAAGLARVDFFYVEDENRLLINEINTIPGFTKTSMYPRLWEAAGIGYSELIETLLQLALEPR